MQKNNEVNEVSIGQKISPENNPPENTSRDFEAKKTQVIAVFSW